MLLGSCTFYHHHYLPIPSVAQASPFGNLEDYVVTEPNKDSPEDLLEKMKTMMKMMLMCGYAL